MSLVSQLSDLVTRIGTEFKSVRTAIGTLASLTTTAKGDLVSAINEVKAAVGGAGATINDTTATTSSVYSSSKTDSNIAASVAALVNSSPTALDTLKELADAIGDDANFAATTATALGNRLRIDAAQSLTTPQQAFGQSNLSVYSQAQIGDPTTDFVALFTTAIS